jgi:hypothetical protein
LYLRRGGIVPLVRVADGTPLFASTEDLDAATEGVLPLATGALVKFPPGRQMATLETP